MNITPEQLRAAFRVSAPYYSPTLAEMQSIFAEFQKLQTEQDPVGKDSYIQTVPDHCDRIIWRGNYHALPLHAAPPDLAAQIAQLREALTDMNSGWKYIRESHGDLYGVGWDRAQSNADKALALPNLSADWLRKHDAQVLRDASDRFHCRAKSGKHGLISLPETSANACMYAHVQLHYMAAELEAGK